MAFGYLAQTMNAGNLYCGRGGNKPGARLPSDREGRDRVAGHGAPR